MKSRVGVMLLLATMQLSAWAQGGMWIPNQQEIVADMQSMGFTLKSEDLFDSNQPSLKDAVVWFDGGCTGEVVSNQGLIFTNHHCGFDNIQYHSSVEHDYLKNGFWAKDKQGELPCPGLTVSFVVSYENVTPLMEEQLFNLTDKERAEKLNEAKSLLASQAPIPEGHWANSRNSGFGGLEWVSEDGAYSSVVREYNYGTQFYRIVLLTFYDVRLVGAPPSEIGKFGGDSDNWVWPRHTGDFSVFRIYANKDNKPAAYSTDNIPYTPKKFFPIQLDGVQENEFSMVYGFPGRTEHFLTSPSVEYMVNKQLPLRIKYREVSLGILDGAMRSSDAKRIQYAAKQSSIANAYIKWKGQLIGLKKYDVIQMKRNHELDLSMKLDTLAVHKIDSIYTYNEVYLLAGTAFSEFINSGPELFRFCRGIKQYLDGAKKNEAWMSDDALNQKWQEMELFYKDFDALVESDLFAEMAPMFLRDVSERMEGKVLHDFLHENEDDWALFIETLYENSMFVSKDKFEKHWKARDWERIKSDIMYVLMEGLFEQHNRVVSPVVQQSNQEIEKWMNVWVNNLTQIHDNSVKWCDANSTLRITYGQIKGSHPRDGVTYDYHTQADGILQKRIKGNEDYQIRARLDSLLVNRVYGDYAQLNELPVCFTSTNHTTGGNSGSPALNAKGELVGINFDRSWESTMSDVYYNPEICRNIMVDIRYVLWVIDVYADADYLLREMKLVHREAGK